MLRWWYVTGWLEAVQRIGLWVKGVERTFSLTLLAQTLFAPWRRIITISGRGIDAKIRALLDNLVSRCIGFVIRFVVILVALVAMAGALLAGIFMALLWPFLPLFVFYFAFRGIAG